jgi:hypothetical protein
LGRFWLTRMCGLGLNIFDVLGSRSERRIQM